MFGLFKTNPVVQLQNRYAAKLTEARDLQRKGDIINFAKVSAEAEELLKQLEAAESACTSDAT